MSTELARDTGLDADPQMLQGVGMATVIVLTLVVAVPFVLMIRYLRGAEARALTAHGAMPRPPSRSGPAQSRTGHSGTARDARK